MNIDPHVPRLRKDGFSTNNTNCKENGFDLGATTNGDNGVRRTGSVLIRRE